MKDYLFLLPFFIIAVCGSFIISRKVYNALKHNPQNGAAIWRFMTFLLSFAGFIILFFTIYLWCLSYDRSR